MLHNSHRTNHCIALHCTRTENKHPQIMQLVFHSPCTFTFLGLWTWILVALLQIENCSFDFFALAMKTLILQNNTEWHQFSNTHQVKQGEEGNIILLDFLVSGLLVLKDNELISQLWQHENKNTGKGVLSRNLSSAMMAMQSFGKCKVIFAEEHKISTFGIFCFRVASRAFKNLYLKLLGSENYFGQYSP